MMSHFVYVLTQIDVIKYMLNKPILNRRTSKWSLAFVEYDLIYIPQKFVKGLTNFLADHPSMDIEIFEQESSYFRIVLYKSVCQEYKN